MDRAGKSYWDSVWSGASAVRPVDPLDPSLDNEVNRRLDLWFGSFLGGAHGKRLLEIGCARSAWLPYFALRHGMDVTGLDYSETGCEQERAILAAAGVSGQVHCADLFSPPASLLASFDYVFSFGVAEHFDDVGGVLGAFARFLKPGGELITVIPNLTGTLGLIQRFIDRSVYDIHVAMNVRDFERAHSAAGLQLAECRYFLSTNYGVLNLAEGADRTVSNRLRRFAMRNLSRVSKGVWLFERRVAPLPAVGLFAPYIVARGTAARPPSGE